MLSSAILPLKLRIIWSGTFSDVSYLCVVYVYNDCPQMNQSHQIHHSRTGLTSHIIYAYDAFSSFYFSFFYVLSLTMMTNMTKQMVADHGLSSLSVCALRTSMLNFVLIESFLFESEYHQYFCAPRYFSFSVRLFESYLVESHFLSYFPALYDTNLTNQMVADQGLISLSVCALRTSMLKYVMIESFLFKSEYHEYFRAPRYFSFSVRL